MKSTTRLKLENVIRRLIREESLSESKHDLRFYTNDSMQGIMDRFRLGSGVINIGRAKNLIKGIYGKSYGNEIGFESKSERRDAMKLIQQAFDSGRLNVEDYPLEKE